MTRGIARTWLVRVLVTLFTIHLSLFTAKAQNEPEYRLELGAGAGTVTYLGDLNGNLFRDSQPWMAAPIARVLMQKAAITATFCLESIMLNFDCN